MVIIQTYNPSHYSILAASCHDYLSFYKKEITFRERLNYPPFTHLVLLRLKGKDEEKVMEWSEHLTERLKEKSPSLGVIVLGPAPCPLLKIRGEFRWQILLKGKKPRLIRTLIKDILSNFKLPGQVKLTVDVDPVMML
jgi:primosomal protein N' (replication factor Y)